MKNYPATKTSINIDATLVDVKDKTIDDLIARADLALYEVKNEGKGKAILI